VASLVAVRHQSSGSLQTPLHRISVPLWCRIYKAVQPDSPKTEPRNKAQRWILQQEKHLVAIFKLKGRPFLPDGHAAVLSSEPGLIAGLFSPTFYFEYRLSLVFSTTEESTKVRKRR